MAFFIALMASARMSDNEVLTYIESRQKAGVTEEQIGRELVARGVTPDQVERLQMQLQKSASSRPATNAATQIDNTRANRTRQTTATGMQTINGRQTTNSRQTTATGVARTAGVSQNDLYLTSDSIPVYPVYPELPPERIIYGHNVFNEANLTFAPGQNLATPQNYVLGPGDEVIIDLWGENEEHVRQTISPEGSIMIAQLGPIYLSGNTIDKANSIVRDKFARKYGGVADNRSDISLSLGNIRSIQVDVMGEVASPGTFVLSPFSTVFHALYNAGGINDIGTLRNIEVLRNGKRVATVDIYDYLFKGKQTGNIRLQEGDMIVVPPYSQLVNVEGNVKRPMYYELKQGETLGTVLNYAGGFAGDAYSDMVRVSRSNGRDNELVNVDRGEYTGYRLKDGDVVTVGTIMDRYANRVELRGAVARPGMYAIGTDIFTLRDLVGKADGLLDDAYTGRVMLYRESPDLSLEVEALDLGAILAGTAADIELRRNDMIVVSSVHEINDRGLLTIQGEVARPGDYPYAQHATVEDLILQAGGLLRGASTARVDIARRIVDPQATQATNQLSEIFSLSIDKGLGAADGSTFELQPYDVVTIRRSPGYAQQEFVEVKGEIAFSGPYALTSRNERLTDLLSRAGGVTEHAYLRGASLERRMTEEEITARREALETARLNAEDSVAVEKIVISEYYNVGIQLDKAVENPGGQYDVVLKAGDRLIIPEVTTTVAIHGEVLSPNTVTFDPGKRVKDYVNMAGGYTDKANKGKVYVVYMNGNVAKVSGRTKLEPGCQVIIPAKSERQGQSVMAEIMGYVTSLTSLGVMAASIASLLKK